MDRNPAHDEERKHYTLFATNEADQDYRSRLVPLYDCWRRWNEEHFAGRLLEPHLGFGPTHSRMVGYCEPTTQYGGRVQITLNDNLVFGTNTRWVVRPWPAAGVRLLIEDLLLRLTVRQYVLEVHEDEESTYDGFGSLFAAEANRLGGGLGLPPVVCRKRAGEALPVARFWPHNLWRAKDPRRYGDDVTEELLDLAAGTNGARRNPAPSSLGTWELVRLYLASGRTDRLLHMASAHVTRLHDRRTNKPPVLRPCEAGLEDTDGQALGEVLFDPDWLTRDNGTVRQLAEAIYQSRAFADLPILADVLEDAGCADGRILRHLRHPMEHNCHCWVLRRLLAADRGAGGSLALPQGGEDSGTQAPSASAGTDPTQADPRQAPSASAGTDPTQADPRQAPSASAGTDPTQADPRQAPSASAGIVPALALGACVNPHCDE